MKSKIIKIATITLTLLMSTMLIFNTVYAECKDNPCECDTIPDPVKEEVYGCSGIDHSNDLQNSVISILNGVIGILGLIAVIVIIIGGVNYMTSSGDSSKVKKAKDTILYASIGLVICALAAAIVNFVIDKL